MKDPRRVIADFRQGLDELLLEFAASAKRYLDEKKTRLMIGRGMIIRQSPLARIRQHRLKLSGDTSAMTGSVRLYLSHRGSAITRCAAMLESLSPLSVLKRGYGIVRKLPGGTIVKEAAALVPGNTVSVKVASGHFEAEVTSTSEE
jgi:exodeoxyribonuclease VII large subunit